MADLIYFVATSIDGFIAAEDGGTGDFVHDPEYLAQLAARYPQSFPSAFHEALGIDIDAAPGPWSAVVMGRSTLEPALEQGIRSPYAHLDQYVVSTSLDPAQTEPVRVIAHDPLDVVRTLRDRSAGDVWLCGGGVLASSLAPLIDRLIIKVNPVTLGSGRGLFTGAAGTVRWSLVDARPMAAGVVMLEYRRLRDDRTDAD